MEFKKFSESIDPGLSPLSSPETPALIAEVRPIRWPEIDGGSAGVRTVRVLIDREGISVIGTDVEIGRSGSYRESISIGRDLLREGVDREILLDLGFKAPRSTFADIWS
jgi:hypothetical protein